jgi:RNA polymerase sigma-70 factor (ECF subfamily)
MASFIHSLPAFAATLAPRPAANPCNSEQDLILAAKTGDRASFGELVDRHGPGVLRLAFRMTHSEQDAYDAYQSTFLKVLTAIRSFRGECAFQSWIYRIAANFCIAILRERNRTRDSIIYVNGEGEPFDFFEHLPEERPSRDPEQQLLNGELNERIAEALKKLTVREKVVFHLKHHEGLRLREIGTIINSSEETAKNTLFRATKKLRLELCDLR